MTTEFRLMQDEWVQIAPLGDHAHEQGIQRIDRESVGRMTRQFNSLAGRVGRVFSGAPLFEGHHDTDPERYPNGKSFAWVMELADRGEEGMWGRLKWTGAGREMVANGNYKFLSPVWRAREIGSENGRRIYRPEALVSLALTNLPNLPLAPLANERANMKTLIEILELKEGASGEEICAAAETLANARSSEKERGERLVNELAEARGRVAEERAARVELILANAILANRITLAEKEQWKGELEKDLAGAEEALAKRRTELRTESETRELGNEKNRYDTEAARREALLAYMDEQESKGVKRADAWERAKVERAEIFARMGKPGQ